MPRKTDGIIYELHPRPTRGEEALEEALHKSMLNGYTTAKRFMLFSGLKETMARRFLNARCEGDNPLLYRNIEGRTVQYRFKKPSSPAEK